MSNKSFAHKRSAVRAACKALGNNFEVFETLGSWSYRGKSQIAKPVSKVWAIASQMPGARRKDVVEAAVAQGIAFYTARTQYQAWHAAHA